MSMRDRLAKQEPRKARAASTLGGAMDAQIAIRGGSVVDGTGAPARRADVGIADGRIVEIGDRVTGAARDRRDGHASSRRGSSTSTRTTTRRCCGTRRCRRRVGTASRRWSPATAGTASPRRARRIAARCCARSTRSRTCALATLEAGVEWDFETYGEYLDAVARRGTAINFGGYVGHTPVRLYVMGDDAYERKATDDEIDADEAGRRRLAQRRRARLLERSRRFPHR